MDLGLRGKVAIVTGGSRGIGRAICLGLAEEGCHVALCARGEERLSQTEAEIRARGVEAPGVVAEWGGDRWVLVRDAQGGWGLVWASVWDSAEARDALLRHLGPEPAGFGGPARLEPLSVDGRPGALLLVGPGRAAVVHVRVAPER